MREQIYELIDSYAGMWNADKTALASKMESLMCYREVTMYYQAYKAIGAENIPENCLDLECFHILKGSYAEDSVLKAIERYKNENK